MTSSTLSRKPHDVFHPQQEAMLPNSQYRRPRNDLAFGTEVRRVLTGVC